MRSKTRTDSQLSATKKAHKKKQDNPYQQKGFRHQYRQLADEVEDLSDRLIGQSKKGSGKINLNSSKNKEALSPLL